MASLFLPNVALAVLLGGCGFENVMISPQEQLRQLQQDQLWRNQQNAQLQIEAKPYLGQNREVIQATFGGPNDKYHGNFGNADERWDYDVFQHGRRIASRRFYFKNERLIEVEFF